MLKSSVAASPAAYSVTLIGTIVSLITGFAHLTPAQTAALFSIAMAAGTIITASRAKNVAAATIAGAAVVILGDFSVFGLPSIPADSRAALIGVITFALGAFLHIIHVPVTDTAKEPNGAFPPATK